jgi:hypothetical protein
MTVCVKLSKSQAEEVCKLINSIPDFVIFGGTAKKLDNFDYDSYYRAFPNELPRDYNLYTVSFETNPKGTVHKENSVELDEYFKNVDKVEKLLKSFNT